MDIHPVEYFLFHSTGQGKHEFYLTRMDTMNRIKKYPVYPVNPCLDKFQIADFRKGLTGINRMDRISVIYVSKFYFFKL